MRHGKITILHITPHLGGGVGRVLLSFLENTDGSGHSHKVLCLDYANESATDALKKIGVALIDKIATNHKRIITEVKNADIVIIHWWNHPLLSNLLITTPLPPSRAVIWSHVAGHHPPQVFTEPLLNYPDFFVFTTEYSRSSPCFKNLERNDSTRFFTIPSCIDTGPLHNIEKNPHPTFNIGYIGTVDYSKIHVDFIQMSIDAAKGLEGIKFIVCGGPSHKELEMEASAKGAAGLFQFEGPVSKIEDYLKVFDLFGYPLSPWHYGTAEQALVEAMSAGVPPLVLNNGAESFILENGVTGFIAKDSGEYSSMIKRLYNSRETLSQLSKQIRQIAKEKFSMQKMIDDWNDLFDSLMRKEKSTKHWNHSFVNAKNVSPSMVFLESIGSCGEMFKSHDKIQKLVNSSPLWRAKTKGTPLHYASFFPNDPDLTKWTKEINPKMDVKPYAAS